MASIRDLKKDINFVLGDFIEAVYLWERSAQKPNSKEGSVLIDKAIGAFDDLMARIHQKNVGDAKAHFKSIRVDLEEKAVALFEELGKLTA